MFNSSGNLWSYLFKKIKVFSVIVLILVLSIKTEVGSVGEQPADNLMLFKSSTFALRLILNLVDF